MKAILHTTSARANLFKDVSSRKTRVSRLVSSIPVPVWSFDAEPNYFAGHHSVDESEDPSCWSKIGPHVARHGPWYYKDMFGGFEFPCGAMAVPVVHIRNPDSDLELVLAFVDYQGCRKVQYRPHGTAPNIQLVASPSRVGVRSRQLEPFIESKNVQLIHLPFDVFFELGEEVDRLLRFVDDLSSRKTMAPRTNKEVDWAEDPQWFVTTTFYG
jgi:hypothetical protein